MISVFQKGILPVLFVCFLAFSALRMIFLWELKFSMPIFKQRKNLIYCYCWFLFTRRAFHTLNFSVVMLKMQWRGLLPSP